ncbi:MAG: TRAM domain-containing protein [Halobacteriales archaeon]
MTSLDDLLCLFSAEIEQRDGSYVVEIPESEFELGTLDEDDLYRIAVLSTAQDTEIVADAGVEDRSGDADPPVSEGDQLEVEIESIGEQGDGVARVEPGYVIFVPDTEVGDRVEIEVTQVLPNFGFGEVIEIVEESDVPTYE